MKFPKFIDEVEIMGVFYQWKELNKKYEKYVSEAPVGGYEIDAPEQQLVSFD